MNCFNHLWHQAQQDSIPLLRVWDGTTHLLPERWPLNRSNTNHGGQQAWHKQQLSCGRKGGELLPSKYYPNMTSSANLYGAAAHEDGRERHKCACWKMLQKSSFNHFSHSMSANMTKCPFVCMVVCCPGQCLSSIIQYTKSSNSSNSNNVIIICRCVF